MLLIAGVVTAVMLESRHGAELQRTLSQLRAGHRRSRTGARCCRARPVGRTDARPVPQPPREASSSILSPLLGTVQYRRLRLGYVIELSTIQRVWVSAARGPGCRRPSRHYANTSGPGEDDEPQNLAVGRRPVGGRRAKSRLSSRPFHAHAHLISVDPSPQVSCRDQTLKPPSLTRRHIRWAIP